MLTYLSIAERDETRRLASSTTDSAWPNVLLHSGPPRETRPGSLALARRADKHPVVAQSSRGEQSTKVERESERTEEKRKSASRPLDQPRSLDGSATRSSHERTCQEPTNRLLSGRFFIGLYDKGTITWSVERCELTIR